MIGQCQALDMHGKRCGVRKGLKPVNYHGDSEIYYLGDFYAYYDGNGQEPGWVVVYLCSRHRSATKAPSEPGGD